jgi:hypothetical protein
MAPWRKLAERKCSLRRSLSASSCLPGSTALREGVEPPLQKGPAGCVVGSFAAPQDDRPQRAGMPASELAHGARARILQVFF